MNILVLNKKTYLKKGRNLFSLFRRNCLDKISKKMDQYKMLKLIRNY